MTAQENGQLFRREAIAYRAQAAEGKPRLASPPAFHVLCVLLGTAVLIAIVFLSTGSYARKATVAGLIEADLGIKRVVSPRSAVVERVYVMAGASVNVGDPLVRLKTTPDLDESQRQQMLAEYQEQLRSIRQRIEHLNDQQQQEHQRLVQRRLQLLNSVNEHHTIIRLQSMKRDEIAATRDAASPLHESGLISRLEWGRLNENFLAAEQQLARLRSEQTVRETEVNSNEVALSQLESRFGAELLQLEQEQSSVRQQVANLEGREAFDVLAPANGIATRLYLNEGHAVSREQPLVSIRPKNALLEARLYIPSRSAGFVSVGQRVNLLYDAFPHQQFGSHVGTLTSISEHALLPGIDADPSIREPVFEATVALESPYVQAYGESVALRHGMTLRADIVLEERTLLAWLLEPLRIMRGRT